MGAGDKAMTGIFVHRQDLSEMFFIRGKDVDYEDLTLNLRRWMEKKTSKIATIDVVQFLLELTQGQLADIAKAGGVQVRVDDFYLSVRKDRENWEGMKIGQQVKKYPNTIHPEKMTDLTWSRPKPKPFSRDGGASGGKVYSNKPSPSLKVWLDHKQQLELEAKKAAKEAERLAKK
jgi:hypothetical protein